MSKSTYKVKGIECVLVPYEDIDKISRRTFHGCGYCPKFFEVCPTCKDDEKKADTELKFFVPSETYALWKLQGKLS